MTLFCDGRCNPFLVLVSVHCRVGETPSDRAIAGSVFLSTAGRSSVLLSPYSAGDRLHHGKRVARYVSRNMNGSLEPVSSFFTVCTPLSACPLLCGK